MQTLSLPSKVEIKADKNKNEAIISISPCYPGYGTTLGNALRRVMLSSLPGGAVTAFRIKGAQHEFSSIENVKEDGVEITLNLKQLRLRVNSDEPVRLFLKAKGQKEVTAKDIEKNSDVEVANQDMTIATLTSKDAELEMEMIVSRGYGFVPFESQDTESLEVGMIAIDSIFTPVKNVGFKIENVRVGQMTNYENLILNVETDGSITPQEALNQSARVLIDHFNFILDQSNAEPKKTETKDKEAKKDKEEIQPEEEAETADKPKKRGRPKKEEKAEAEKE